MDLEVEAGHEAKFTCAGSTDFDEARHMQIYWEKDDKRLTVDHQRVSQNLNDNSLTISGTVVRDSGVYTCIITNGLDEDRAYAILTVKGIFTLCFNTTFCDFVVDSQFNMLILEEYTNSSFLFRSCLV
jgi:hypothetical protein